MPCEYRRSGPWPWAARLLGRQRPVCGTDGPDSCPGVQMLPEPGYGGGCDGILEVRVGVW
jgi:hypothetical protein